MTLVFDFCEEYSESLVSVDGDCTSARFL